MNDRIRELENMLKDDPKDQFLYYALGLEYMKTGNVSKALERFDILLKRFPDYLPVYYQAAHLYVELNDLKAAESTFKKGITLAREQSETKTLQELSNAYDNFLFDNDLL